MNSNVMRKVMGQTDLLAALGVVLIVVMLIIPLPPMLLDFFITLNISAGIAIVVSTLYLRRALDFASFPSLLLLTTMFRLAINVSVTRLILTTGDAGHVIRAFGDFVVGGNVVVGLVIFFILIVIQFVVVTNGASRVAEVGARFTLDAMPGKQMAIDADLNAGLITDDEARRRRAEISQEADFYGSMDGASKFVRGDAIAAIVIVLINLIGGLAVGIMQMGMPFGEAIQHFSLLTIGDGLAAQIPALLISVATGILVTRAASDRDLGHDISDQILKQRKAPLVAGGAILAFALVPGLPKIPFIVIGGIFFAIGWMLRRSDADEAEQAEAKAIADAEGTAVAQPRDAALEALPIDPLELAIGFGLVRLVDQNSGGTLLSRVSVIRRQIATELGMVIPPVRIHDELGLDSHEYVLKVRGTEVARGSIMANHQLAMDPGDAVGQLQGVPTTEPAFGLPATWVSDSQRAEAEALGYTVVDGESVIVTHLTEMIRGHAAELLTRQDTRQLLDQLKESNEAVVNEVVPDMLTLGEIQRVLQNLLAEGVSIRDLGTIVEAIGDKARLTRDPSLLSEYARQALGRTITAPYVDGDQRLRAIALDPAIEQEVAASISQTSDGEYLAMDPVRAQALVSALRTQVEHAVARGSRPVLLCSARVRRHMRRLVEQAIPHLAVCSYNEIAPGISVETIGVIEHELAS
ncbi:flagellar biosynthesis protein FlhA [Conexibacter stalactiti]|uniref:Flagellar biosynthesis protein FlhA n=1 Tax=Conexibacter stalactiti TaxID=1940611 RepID=A0ABU4I027_9ACTN|nr:flagellar biosynthesis protein FlhA [Conexibacter stalactiti]MDW5597679.1 flagellar biosynthesis protein FlhA [Conexibacter stalactiti]MEC5038321.1 flagellar biosynthesis protein FlhA [Conexibacter stalactiti]